VGYKLLGYVVWHVGKRYARHHMPEARRGIALAAIGALVLTGVAAAAARHRGTE
jgi:hypothetical protein